MSPMSDDAAGVEHDRLRGEVVRLRALLETERASCLADMTAGAIELEERDARLARQRELADDLRGRVRRLRERAQRHEARIAELEAELARREVRSPYARLRSVWGRWSRRGRR